MFRNLTTRMAVVGAIATLGLTAGVSPAVAAGPASWRVADTGDLPGQDSMNAVVATGPGNAWAFGGSLSLDGRFAPIARRWNGRSWADATLPAGLARGITTADATGPHNVWAFAGGDEAGEAYALRWNGHRWTVMNTWPEFEILSGAAVVSARDVWVFGGSRIGPGVGTWHYDGRTWTQVETPVGLLGRADAVTSRDIWAVGTDHEGYDLVARWNGRAWTKVDVPGLPREETHAAFLDAIHATSSRDVWVVGHEYHASGDEVSETPLALHYDGHTWTRHDPPGQGNLADVTSDGHGGAWVAPLAQEPYDAPELLHFANGRWTQVRPPRADGLAVQVHDVTPVPGSRSVWAVGGAFRPDDGSSDSMIWVHGRLPR